MTSIPDLRGVQSPDRSSISRIVLFVCCVGLLIVPPVSAIGSTSATGGAPAIPAQSSSSASPLLAGGQTPSGDQSPTEHQPIGVATGVKLAYEGEGTHIPLTITVTVKKLNQSTAVIVHQHNQRVKRWYTTTDAIVEHGALADGPTDSALLKDILGDDIESTAFFTNTIKPSVRKQHKTGEEGYKQKGRENRKEFNEMVSNVTPDLPGPVEAAKDIYRATVNAVRTGVDTFIEAFTWVVVELPAPGTPTKPTTWFPGYASPLHTSTPTVSTTPPEVSGAAGFRPLHGTGATGQPTAETATNATGNATNTSGPASQPPANVGGDGWWQTVWTIYGGLAALVVLPVFVAWIYAWSRDTNSPREREAQVRQLGLTVGLIVGGPVVLPLALHLTNALALGIVPDTGTLLATPGNATKFGLGLLIWGVLVVLESGLVLTALLILFVEWVIVFLVVAAWPLFAVCLGSGNRYLKPYGESALVALGSILVLKLVQVIWLRFLLQLPLEFGQPGMSLLTIAATIVGIILGFIYLPYYVVTNISPTFVTSLGGGGGASQQSLSQAASTVGGGEGRESPQRSSVRSWTTSEQTPSSQSRAPSGAPTSRAGGSPTATDGGSQPTSRMGKRARRVEAIRQRGYRQDATFEQFPDMTDGATDDAARSRTTAEPGHSGRTPEGAAGTAVETTSTAVSAAGKVGTALSVAADARRTAKAHWEGAKRYWRSTLPGNRSRPTKPVEPLRQKARRHATNGWQAVKHRGHAEKDRLVDRERRQRQDQRREHVRDQQEATDETDEQATDEQATTTTDTTSTEESSVDDAPTTAQRRYFDQIDHQKYGDILDERLKSTVRQHAERRYRSRAGETDEDSDSTETDSEPTTDEIDDTE